MRNILRKSYLALLLSACIIACFAMLWIARYFVLEDSQLVFSTANPYNTGWVLVTKDGEIATETVTREVTPELDKLIIRNILPDELVPDAALFYRINDEATRVFVGDEEIFSYGYENKNPFGKSYGTVWLSAPLTPEMAGQAITVEIESISGEASDGDYTFYLDQHDTVLMTILKNNAPLVLTTLIGCVLALLLLTAGIASINSGLNLAKPRSYLALFVFTGQAWVLAQADLLQFWLGNKAVGHFIAHSLFMMLPVFFALYLSELLVRRKRHYRILVVMFSSYLLLRIALYFLNICDIGAYTSLTHALIGIGVTYAVTVFLVDKDAKLNPIVRIGVICFLLCASAAMLYYWMVPYLNTDMPVYALLLGLGIDMLMIFYYSALLLNHRYLASNRQHFEHQAYTDAMTQVNNRAAYDYISPTLKPDTYPRLTLIMFDMNTLKQVNDTLGHLAGDKLVCALVNYLQLAFGAIGKIYRFGGDEFVVTIENAPLEDVQAARADFDRLIEEHSRHGGNEISVAIGMASRQEKEFAGFSIENLLFQADKAMYAMKTVMKSRPSMHEITTQRLKQIDPMTSILTFDAFKACVYDALSGHKYTFPCIITFDLNFFDGYNTLFGWDEGNLLLQKMANMALKLCGSKGFCAHANADHFWVFADTPDEKALADMITAETQAFQSQFKDCLLFPSFGIYHITDHNLPVSNMCSNAASAQKRVKGRLDSLYNIYSVEDHNTRTETMRLLSLMRKALEDDAFVPFYQPKFSIDRSRLLGAEALVRWDESAAMLPDFSELFEHSGLILTLDWYMLEKTCRQVRSLMERNIPGVPISTNFSRLHVYEPDCVSRVRRLLEKYQVPAHLVGIEFTSSAMSQDPSVNDKLNVLYGGLRALGVCVTLDDFNCNLSSLANLGNLNADIVKINCRLATDTASLAPDISTFRFVVGLCKAFGIRTLVDNINSQEQMETVARFRCDLVQGDHIAPPMSADEFEVLLQQYRDRLGQ